MSDLIAATRLVISNDIQIDMQSDLSARTTLEFERWPRATIGNLFHDPKNYVSFHSHLWILIEVVVPQTFKSEPNHRFFGLCDLEIWRMKSKNSRTPLLCICKLSEPFRSHLWIKSGITAHRKRPNWDKICFDLCDIDLWPLIMPFCINITFVYGNE